MRGLAATVIIFLSMIQNGPQEQAPPVDRYTCTPPAGVTLHLTNSQVMVDSEGQVFCATRADSSIGSVVWTMDGTTPRILIPTDPHKYYANGEFSIIGGYLYYCTVPDTKKMLEAVLVPEWDR